MKCLELTEENIIRFIEQTTLFPRRKDLVVGIGDDAAVISTRKNGEQSYWVLTKDILIEGVHFPYRKDLLFKIGWKALVVNASDIYAMGAQPSVALVGLGIPRKMDFESFTQLYTGISDAASKLNTKIIGGDTSLSDSLFISVTLMGESNKVPIKRHGARVDDYVVVTGNLGASAAGCELLKTGILNGPLVERHLCPPVKAEEAHVISTLGLATAMIDISDGLVLDLWRMTSQSRVGAVIYESNLPVDQCLMDCTQLLNPYIHYVLYGGEDYELLFTCPPDRVQVLRNEFEHQGLKYFIIGQIIQAEKILLRSRQDRMVPLEIKGFQHFGG